MITLSLEFRTFNNTQCLIFTKVQKKTILYLAVLLLIAFFFPVSAFAASSINLTKINGGSGGVPFVDMVAPGGRITSITIRSGAFIDSIKVNYQYRNGNKVFGTQHGGRGGSPKTFVFRNGEYITTLGGRSGKYVDSIYINTNQGRSMRWGGGGGENAFRVNATASTPILGIWGQSGRFLDAIAVIQKPSLKHNIAYSGNAHRTNYANTKNTSNRSNELVQRLIKANGNVIKKYRDGTIKENYSGGQRIKRPGQPESFILKSTQAPPAIPPAIPSNSEQKWLSYHSQNLLRIIKTLVNNKQETVDNYLKYEGVNSSVYKKITTRENTIQYLVAP